MMFFILYSIVCLLITWILGNILMEFWQHHRAMSALPGPKGLPILANLPDLLDSDGVFMTLRRLSREYNTVYNLAATVFFPSANIVCPEDFEIIASSVKNLSKGKVYEFLHRWLGDGLLTSTGAKWQQRRKILTPAFHMNILQEFVQVFNKETAILVEILKSKLTEPYVNVIPLISHYTLKTIAETSMGTSLDISNQSDMLYVTSTHRIGKIFFERMMRPWMYINIIFYYLFPLGRLERRLLNNLRGFTDNIIKQRQATFANQIMQEYNYSDRKRLALLDLLLNVKELEDAIDDEGIADEVNTFMFEGHDTTSVSICFTLMMLACHKDVQDKVYEEIIQTLGPSNRHPTIDDLNNLEYTERVLKESLRLYPSVPFINRTMDEDIVTHEGYHLLAGSQVNIHIFDIHRHLSHWPEPEKFDPDRFSPENSIGRHRYAHVPFSSGPRNCIGRKYAMLELKATLCGILRSFKLEPIDTPKTIKLIPDMVLRTAGDCINVKFIERN